MKSALLALAAALFLSACVNLNVYFPGAPSDAAKPATPEKPAR